MWFAPVKLKILFSLSTANMKYPGKLSCTLFFQNLHRCKYELRLRSGARPYKNCVPSAIEKETR